MASSAIKISEHRFNRPVKKAAGRNFIKAPSLEDLPSTDKNFRWRPLSKAKVVTAIKAGLISFEYAIKTWQLSEEELLLWIASYEKHGVPGLRTVYLQVYKSGK